MTDQSQPIQGTTALHPIEDVGRYPRPPLLESVPYPILITLGGQDIVSTRNAYRVLETYHPPTYYIPPQDVAEGALTPHGQRSVCEWKGPARYFTVKAGGKTIEAGAWTYSDPQAHFAPIRDHLAFYCAPMDRCLVDGIPATPQPGGFYGGWVTPWIMGQIKGAPGTAHW